MKFCTNYDKIVFIEQIKIHEKGNCKLFFNTSTSSSKWKKGEIERDGQRNRRKMKNFLKGKDRRTKERNLKNRSKRYK